MRTSFENSCFLSDFVPRAILLPSTYFRPADFSLRGRTMSHRSANNLHKRITQRDRSKRLVAGVTASIAGLAALSTGALVFVLDHHAGASTSSTTNPTNNGTFGQPGQGTPQQDPYGQGYSGNGYGYPTGGNSYGYPAQGNGGGGYSTGGS
jgi:hypothetical protein